MLHGYGLNMKLQTEVMNRVPYIINHTSTRAIKDVTGGEIEWKEDRCEAI